MSTILIVQIEVAINKLHEEDSLSSNALKVSTSDYSGIFIKRGGLL